jgi:quercetin dioxygenase-like cupin family protein
MSAEHPDTTEQMQVHRNGSTSAIKGPSEWFTGQVRLDRVFNPPAPARGGIAFVNFEPGARSFWHTHPLGQTLIVTSGVGWTQCEGGPKTEIRAGDVIWCPCQRRHWHGATATTAMSHIAIAEALDGKSVDWLEPVTEEQYLSGPVGTA